MRWPVAGGNGSSACSSQTSHVESLVPCERRAKRRFRPGQNCNAECACATSFEQCMCSKLSAIAHFSHPGISRSPRLLPQRARWRVAPLTLVQSIPLPPIRKLLLLCLAAMLLTTPAEAKRSKSKRGSAKKTAANASTALSARTKLLAAKARAGFSTVVIDAGHGGQDPGGIPENIIPEKGVALDVAQRLQKHLEAAGLRTVMTRTDDTFITLGERVRIANAEPDAVFVSVHFNAALRLEARGVETFYGSVASAPLARLIQRNLLAVTVNPDNRPVRHATFWVLRETKLRAVLAECGFLTNKDDAALTQQEEHREKLSLQIAEAIVEWRRSLGSN